MTQTKFGYFYTTTTTKPGYITVAITRADKDAPDQRHFAALSFCSPKDVFSKTLGRKIAENRLASKKHVIEVSLAGSIPEVVKAVMQKAVEEKLVPAWVKKAYSRDQLHYGLNRNALVTPAIFENFVNPGFDFNEAMAMLSQMFRGDDPTNPPGVTEGGCCESGECKDCRCGCVNCG